MKTRITFTLMLLVLSGCVFEEGAPLRISTPPMTLEERIEFNRSPLHELACYECKWGRSLEEQSAWEVACYEKTQTYDCRGLK